MRRQRHKKQLVVSSPEDLDRLRSAVRDRAQRIGRWRPDPNDARRSVLKLVLTLVELIRRLLERQALRRMDRGTLSDAEIEAVGVALEQLERTVHELAAQFELTDEDLNLDLGPLGRLL